MIVSVGQKICLQGSNREGPVALRLGSLPVSAATQRPYFFGKIPSRPTYHHLTP